MLSLYCLKCVSFALFLIAIFPGCRILSWQLFSLSTPKAWSTVLWLPLSFGNPLQCSCLQNPRMAEPGRLPSMGSHSRTLLKGLSSSSSSLSLLRNQTSSYFLFSKVTCLFILVHFFPHSFTTTHYGVNSFLMNFFCIRFCECVDCWILSAQEKKKNSNHYYFKVFL